MRSWIRRQGPTFAVACLALTVALGGSVYAAARIDGHSIRRGSLPGNRLKRGTVPGNRLARGSIGGGRIAPGSLTGVQVNAATLGKVAEAAAADRAASARTATTALAARFASEAGKVNGRSAGCAVGRRFFAGACWETETTPATTATAAAATCAARGGELPPALALAAFGAQPEVALAPGGEWTREVVLVSGPNEYAVVTVSRDLIVDSEFTGAPRPFRCVIPLVT